MSVTEAAIDRGWEITDRGLTIVPGVSFDEWSEAWTTICGMHRVAMWALGDCVRLGFEMFNEEASQIVDEYAPETTKVALWVSERIEPARRHPAQSWSAHRAVASLPPAEQDEILALAEANGWHSREVGAEVKRRKAKPANDVKLLSDQRNWPQVDEGEPIGEEITRIIDPLDIPAILDEIREDANRIMLGADPAEVAQHIITVCESALAALVWKGRAA